MYVNARIYLNYATQIWYLSNSLPSMCKINLFNSSSLVTIRVMIAWIGCPKHHELCVYIMFIISQLKSAKYFDCSQWGVLQPTYRVDLRGGNLDEIIKLIQRAKILHRQPLYYIDKRNHIQIQMHADGCRLKETLK